MTAPCENAQFAQIDCTPSRTWMLGSMVSSISINPRRFLCRMIFSRWSQVMPYAVATIRSCIVFQKISAIDFTDDTTVQKVFSRSIADALPEVPVYRQVIKVEAFDISDGVGLTDDYVALAENALDGDAPKIGTDDADAAQSDTSMSTTVAQLPAHASAGLVRACFEFEQFLTRVRLPIDIAYLDSLINGTQRDLKATLRSNFINADWASEAIGTDLESRAFVNQTYGSLFDMIVPALSIEAVDSYTSIISFEGFATQGPSFSPAPSAADAAWKNAEDAPALASPFAVGDVDDGTTPGLTHYTADGDETPPPLFLAKINAKLMQQQQGSSAATRDARTGSSMWRPASLVASGAAATVLAS